jgi:transposase
VRKGEPLPWIVPDGLWERIEPLLPKVERRYRHPGRRRLSDRQVLCGILFVLYTAIPWEFLPQELGFGSGMTCWRWLAEWQEAGVWQRLHELLLAELHAAERLDWSRAVVDSSHVRALKGGPKPARVRRPRQDRLEAPCDHRRRGHPPGRAADRRQPSRRHPTPATDRGDPTGTRPTRPTRRRPDALYADRAYDHDKYRRQVNAKAITPHIARRGVPHGSGLGVYRWVVEQTVALLHWFRRLRTRWEIRDDIHEAFMSLACAIICLPQAHNMIILLGVLNAKSSTMPSACHRFCRNWPLATSQM